MLQKLNLNQIFTVVIRGMGWWFELVLGPRRRASRLRGALLGMAMLAATSRGRITARLPAALRTCGVRSVHLKVRSCRACLSPATPHPTRPHSAALRRPPSPTCRTARWLASACSCVSISTSRRPHCCAPNVLAFTDAAAYRPQTAPAGGRQPRCGHMDASSGGAPSVFPVR